MKKIKTLVLICSLSMAALVSFGQQKNIPDSVLNNFKTMYPNAQNADWDTEKDGSYNVEFTDNGKKMEAYYDTKNSWIRTERDVKRAEVPEAIWNALSKSQYADWKVDDMEEHRIPENKIVYEIEVEQNGKEVHLNYLPDGTILE
jgi:hypothetical protein